MIKETILLYSEYIALGTILLLSIIGHNMTVAYAAGIVFVIKALGLTSLLQVIGSNGIHWGILILTVAILIPIATGEITLHIMLDSFKTPLGIIAIIAGILAVAAGGSGVALLKTSPEVVSALLIGTMAGVFFFKGIAVGPLIAGGFTYAVMQLLAALK